MKGDIIDTILILLMILVLPVGIFFASSYQKKAELTTADSEAQAVKAKLDETLQKLEAATTAEKLPASPSIEISEVKYSSISGELAISGKAPGSNLNVMVSAMITPSGTNRKRDDTATSSAVLGEKVEVVAVKTNNDGTFTFIKKITKTEADLIELRFDQDKSSATVQYNLLEDRRTL